MKTVLVYSFPLDARETFAPFARRYVESYLKHPPGCEHTFALAMMNPEELHNPNRYDQWIKIFEPLKPFTFAARSNGIDIGAAQEASKLLSPAYDFAVFSTSRVYFHRPGWLKRLVDAREKGGEGLYGATGSYECPNGEPEKFPNPHMRTVLYGCNPKHMDELAKECPVTDRATAHKFEAGEWNFATWFRKKGYPVKMVTSDQELDFHEWRKPDNIFRRGDQSNILCWDKHSLAYAEASPEEKRRLEKITG